MNWIAWLLIVAAASWRAASVTSVAWANFSPVMALAFCGGAYFRRGWMWLVPFAALAGSDIYIARYYASHNPYPYEWPAWSARMLCLVVALLVGCAVAKRRNAVTLAGGILGSSLAFYLVTNTVSWKGDAGYRHDLAGWWQAMTVGHPQFPPTLYFFRNTFLSDLVFTAVFAVAMEAWRRKSSSALSPTR